MAHKHNMAQNTVHNDNIRIDNRARSTRFFLLFIFSGVFFTGIAFYLISQESAYPLIATVVVAIAYFFLFSKIKPSYFEFVAGSDRFFINYYSVASISRDYQSIEVPFTTFSHFKVVRSVFGLRKELVVSVATPYGIADYPPIGISILTKKELGRLVHILTQLITAHQGKEHQNKSQ